MWAEALVKTEMSNSTLSQHGLIHSYKSMSKIRYSCTFFFNWVKGTYKLAGYGSVPHSGAGTSHGVTGELLVVLSAQGRDGECAKRADSHGG